MLMSIGRGLSPAISKPYITSSRRLTLTTALPSEVTFERVSPATCMNINGKLIEVATNEPRFDHDKNGNHLGLMIEPALTNKCTNHNVNPTNTSGIITAGDVNGVLSLIDDSVELTNAGLDLLCTNGNVYKADNTLGTSNFTLYIEGNAGNINPHTLSMYVRAPSSMGRACRLYSGTDTLDIDGNPLWERHALENTAPSPASRKLTIIVDPGKEIYFILNQLEEYSSVTSPILTHGTSATRTADHAYIDNINQYQWFDPTQGYFTCRYSLKELLAADSYLGVINDGSTANTIGLRVDSNAQAIRGYMRSNSAIQFTSANSDEHIADICNTAGTRWNNTDTALLSGGSSAENVVTTLPTGLTRFDLGSRNNGLSPIHGHIQELEIGKTNLSTVALGRKLQKPSDIIIAGGGQSLIRGHFSSIESGSNAGQITHRTLIGERMRENTVIMVDGSTGGSAATKTSNSTNYWWDLATNSRGPAFDTFTQNIANAAIVPTYILWGQGEDDSHQIGINTSRGEYKQALEAIFADMRHTYGDVTIYIQRIGRRTSFSNTGGVQAIREVQNEIIVENAWCYDAAEIYDVSLFDQVHPNDEGFTTAAKRNALTLLDDILGPRITNATLSGTTVTVTITHDTGTDFTPISAIEGFIFFDGSNQISVSNAVRTDANTITLTLASTPIETEQTLYYGYDDMAGLNINNIIHDNSVNQLPLRTTKITVN